MSRVQSRAPSLYDEGGDLIAPLASTPWSVPTAIRLTGRALVYEVTQQVGESALLPPRKPKQAEPDARLLRSFVALASEPETVFAEAALAFATRYGPLMLCGAHHLPYTHKTPSCSLPGREQLADWRALSERAAGLLDLHTRLLANDPWVDAAARLWPAFANGLDAATARAFGARTLNRMLAAAGVQPLLAWSGGEPTLALGARPGGGVWPAIVGQLLLACAGGPGQLWLCSHCGRPYEPSRRPRPGRHYCEACRASGQPQRDAARDAYRRRLARAQQNA